MMQSYTKNDASLNNKAVAPTAPQRAGHTFAGWYKESSCTTAWSFNTNEVNGATTLYAKWVAKITDTLEVTYANGGADSIIVPKDRTKYASGATVTVKSNTGSLAKSGYSFVGWSNGKTTYKAGDTFKITENTVLTAVWLQNATQYTVTYSNNYTGAENNTTQTISYGSVLIKPNAPTRDGYIFIGWYKKAACNKAWSFDLDTITGGTTLYAKWAQSTCSVSGTIEDDATPTKNKIQDAIIKVMQGNIQVGDTVQTDADGKFTVIGVPNGEYNIVITKNGQTTTSHIKVDGSKLIYEVQITMPSKNKNS